MRLVQTLRDVVRIGARRFLLVVLLAAGVLSGLAAVAFHRLIDVAHSLLVGRALAEAQPGLRLALVLLVPTAMGAFLAFVLPRVAPRAGGGLALVRQAAQDDSRRVTPRDFAGTMLANSLSLGAGTPLGPEGPTVVLTSGLSAGVARALGLPARVVKGMVPVGTAAGIAAIFNAPITGVVFALEEILGTVSRGVLGGALVAAVAAAVVEKAVLGGRRLLPAAPADWRDARELVGFALLGIAAGAFAGAIPRVVPVLKRGLRRLTSGLTRGRAVARGAIAGLVVGLLGALAPETLGVGYVPVAGWLAGGGGPLESAIAFVAKTGGVAVALAAPLVGGVFAPSLFIGASLGSTLGHSVHLLFPHVHVDPGAYALVGMGAFFAGFLRTPIASILIVFELTGDYGLVVPQMLTVALATLVARRISPATLVEQQLEAAGAAAPHDARDPLAHRRVEDVMTRLLVTVDGGATLLDAARSAAGTGHRTFPVVDAGGTLLGLLDAEAIDEAAREGKLSDPVADRLRPPRVLATPEEALDAVSLRLAAASETRCAVVETLASRRLAGFLAPSDILRARLGDRAEETGGFGTLG